MKTNKNAFTLIELLAVIVILAIIALIATPIILGIINDAKKSAAELSLKNYIRAVEIAISNEYVKDPTINLNGICEVIENGNKIECGTDVPIKVEYSGEGLLEGIIELKEGIVTRVLGGSVKGISEDREFNNGEITPTPEVEKSTLITGSKFNAALKNLVNGTTDMKYDTEDNSIISIEFYSRGLLPSGYTQDKLDLLPHISVSDNNDIIAYNDSGKVYIVSNNLISFNSSCNYMFYNLKALKQIRFIIINTSDVTSMAYMFQNCSSLINLDLKTFDTTKVTTMANMFQSCTNLINLNLKSFNIENVEWIRYMFKGCSSIETLDLSSFKKNKSLYTSGMFSGCAKLKNLNLSNFDTSNVTDMSYMFIGCSSLKTLDLSSFDTSKVTNMAYMFYNCFNLISLDVSNFNTSQVTSMDNMFAICSSLTSLDLSNFNTSNVTNMSSMFYMCKALESINVSSFNTSQVTTMSSMFAECNSLTSVDLSNFNTSNVTSMSWMFYNCKALESITIGCDWKTANAKTDMFTFSKYKIEQFNKLVEDTKATCQAS